MIDIAWCTDLSLIHDLKANFHHTKIPSSRCSKFVIGCSTLIYKKGQIQTVPSNVYQPFWLVKNMYKSVHCTVAWGREVLLRGFSVYNRAYITLFGKGWQACEVSSAVDIDPWQWNHFVGGAKDGKWDWRRGLKGKCSHPNLNKYTLYTNYWAALFNSVTIFLSLNR